MNKDTLVIIPAFNEEKAIKNVTDEVNKHGFDFVVINDNSADKTKGLLEKYHINHISLPVNLGIGGAMQTGYIYARDHGYSFAVQVDGDGQHLPSEINKLVEAQKKTGANMVIGSRYIARTEYSQSHMRRLGIYIFSVVTKVLTGQSIKDATSGFRLVDRDIIESFARYYPSDYPEPEVIICLKNRGSSIIEVPVKMKSREGGTSSITPLKSVYYIIKVIISMAIQRIGG